MPVVVVRGEERDLGAFANVCRHRAHVTLGQVEPLATAAGGLEAVEQLSERWLLAAEEDRARGPGISTSRPRR